MSYQMESILSKCEMEDYKFIIGQIDSYINLTDDQKLKEAFLSCSTKKTINTKLILINLIEADIRYLGSSDLAYFKRKLFSNNDPPGVDIDEIISDVSDKLKVKQKLVGTVESKLERLVKATVEKTFFSLSPDQQRELFDKAGVDKKQQDDFFEKLSRNKAHFLPLLLSILGPQITQSIIEGIVVSVITVYIGREAAKELIKNLATRFPWWAEWLGPIVWGLSLGWLALDLQGPAYRKTIPILLYLGIVGLRDGPEDGEAFWNEAGEI